MSNKTIYDYVSQKHIDQFKPTLLYIKQHSVTKKLYFGKTNQLSKFTQYNGSGTYWLRHIQKYGIENVETIWFCLFTDIESLVETAILLSETQDIVISENWANAIVETGISGSGVSSPRPSLAVYNRSEIGREQSRRNARINKTRESVIKSNETKAFKKAAGIKSKYGPKSVALHKETWAKNRANGLPDYRSSDRAKARMKLSREANSFMWEITHPNLEKESISGLTVFCRKHNLKIWELCSISETETYKGYSCKKLGPLVI